MCFLIQGGLLGIISNCRGIFYDPVCVELGIKLGKLTTYSVFYGLAVCITIPFASRAVKKWNLRWTLTGFALLTAAAQFTMAYFHNVYEWYAAAAVQGACYAFLFVQTVPMLINNWFSEQSGFFLGIACSASGIVGALMNPLAQSFMAGDLPDAWYRAVFAAGSRVCAVFRPQAGGHRSAALLPPQGAKARSRRGGISGLFRKTQGISPPSGVCLCDLHYNGLQPDAFWRWFNV